MVVQNSQRIAASVEENLVPLKVHLPQLVRRAGLKSDIPPSLRRFGRGYKALSLKDLRNSTRRRNPFMTQSKKPGMDLPPTPRRMSLTNLQYGPHHRIRSAGRGTVRTTGSITKTDKTLFAITPDPFITGLGTYAETTAKLTYVRPILSSKHNKLSTQRHGINLVPWHDNPPFVKGQSYHSKVLPMSPNTRYPCLRSIHLPSREGG
jgi:hypothetical protein